MGNSPVQTRKQATYPAYKPSGMEWIGDIPEHWEAMVLKRTFVILNGSTPKSTEPIYWDGEIPWATPDDLGNLKGDTIEITRRMITQEGYKNCGTSMVPTGSLVLSTRAPIGHLAIAGIPLCTNQGCRCLVFRNTDNHRFYYYQLIAAKGELESWGEGSTFRELGRDKLCTVVLIRPPSSEQQAIASFLDRETARIDALIEKKRRQIELLHEKRSALISHAVTKGLDPKARTKDSGIEWLGEIPEHWEVLAFKRLGDFQGGAGFPNDEQGCEDNELPFYKVSDTNLPGNEIFMTVHNNSVSRETARKLRAYIFSTETVVFAKVGAALLLNKRRILTQPACIDNNMMGFMRRTCELRWAYFWMCSLDLGELANPGAVPSINEGQIREIRVPVPPLSEQRAIAAFLDRETARIDALVDKVIESINGLREYRTALISAAVTGKIDVRKEIS